MDDIVRTEQGCRAANELITNVRDITGKLGRIIGHSKIGHQYLPELFVSNCKAANALLCDALKELGVTPN
jgi:hypothetical protein